MPQHLLLHGILYATICEIDNLQYGYRQSLCTETLGPKVYATVDLDKARLARTRTITHRKALFQPTWNEDFRIYCAHLISNVVFTIKDDSPFGGILLGRAYVPVEDIINGDQVDTWVDIKNEEQVKIPFTSRIHVKLQFLDVARDLYSNWSQGIRSPTFVGVPNTFFKQRHGCKVTLYQDAHVWDEFTPEITLAGGKHYVPQRCWEDIFEAISKAKHLIYIIGWSVYTQITLIRGRENEQGNDNNISLGKLLKKKAKEGVRVLMLVWDDKTSVDVVKRDGLMATHDEETADYFRFSKVHCLLCPRNPDNKRTIIQGIKISTMFTHHQKAIVVDSEIPGETSGKRKIVSFIGGIDLCGGRYDTQEHSLFRTLDTVHRQDFYQPNFPGSSITKGGPREPWHDTHCKLEGPVAWDVLFNFEQRWKRRSLLKKNLLIPDDELKRITIPPTASVVSQDDSETWNVQLFRSIDGGDVDGFPEKPLYIKEIGLVGGKDKVIERSIQDAYINAIRRAKNFIYIENQYFLGSSFGWKSQDIKVEDIEALHLIPKELSLKIVSKIEAGERFAVYIVIPMWPEGAPESATIQAILDWQRRTIEMMYSDIAQALRNKGLNTDLREYLTFFCLGNRERKTEKYLPTKSPSPGSDYSRAQKARRFMIYVHSKMMIVDDEYIIVGSANINQRSMAGSRDSEIAMGAFQPHHLATKEPARGQIFGFRMALWREHLGKLHDSFHHPESVQCVRLVNSIAEVHWEKYSSEDFDEDLPGHLIRYPIEIANDFGGITYIPGIEFFLDTKGRVLGTKSDYLPAILTT